MTDLDAPVFYVKLMMPVGIPAADSVVGAILAKSAKGELSFDVAFYVTQPMELLAAFAIGAQVAARAFAAGNRTGWYCDPVDGVFSTVLTREQVESLRAPGVVPAGWDA